MRAELQKFLALMHASFAKSRMQLSFEFMIYLAVAVSSMAAGIGMLAHFHSSASSMSEEIGIENFASLINDNIGQAGSFRAFVPQGMCGAGSANTTSRLEALVSASAIVIDSNSLCSSGKPLNTVELDSLQNGSIEIK